EPGDIQASTNLEGEAVRMPAVGVDHVDPMKANQLAKHDGSRSRNRVACVMVEMIPISPGAVTQGAFDQHYALVDPSGRSRVPARWPCIAEKNRSMANQIVG